MNKVDTRIKILHLLETDDLGVTKIALKLSKELAQQKHQLKAETLEEFSQTQLQEPTSSTESEPSK